MVDCESVQYFKFDSMGNMFLYEPGSGFLGEAKLVQGFEMQELSNWSQMLASAGNSFADTLCSMPSFYTVSPIVCDDNVNLVISVFSK